jgi:hypothetical protein
MKTTPVGFGLLASRASSECPRAPALLLLVSPACLCRTIDGSLVDPFEQGSIRGLAGGSTSIFEWLFSNSGVNPVEQGSVR